MSALALALRQVLLRNYPGDRWFELNDPSHPSRSSLAQLPVVHHRFISQAEHAVNVLVKLDLALPIEDFVPLFQLSSPAAFERFSIDTRSIALLTSAIMMFSEEFSIPTNTWEPFDVPEQLHNMFHEIKALGILDDLDAKVVWNDDAPAVFYRRA